MTTEHANEHANARIRAIDLCCGAGGWAAAGRGLPIEWVAVVDWADDCLETWRVNHQAANPNCRRLSLDLSKAESIDKVVEAAGARVDLVVGGIPCEAISRARHATQNPATGEDFSRFMAILDNCLTIVERLAPRWWSIEDVIGIERWLPTPLFEGRDVPYRRIQAADYGPQRRLRTFLGVFDVAEPASPQQEPFLLKHVLRPGPYRTVPGADELRAVTRCDYTQKGVCRVMDPDLPSPTVMNWGGRRERRGCFIAMPDGRRRRITFQEAAALQGFPDDYVFAACETRAWKMVGQAISVYMGRAILTETLKAESGELMRQSQSQSPHHLVTRSRKRCPRCGEPLYPTEDGELICLTLRAGPDGRAIMCTPPIPDPEIPKSRSGDWVRG